MIQTNRESKLIIDVNTQEDLFSEGSSSCVKDYSQILPRIRRIMAWARINKILVVSICRVFPCNSLYHSVYNKISYTVLKNRFTFPITTNTDIPLCARSSYRQIVLYSRSDDPFDEPLIDRFFDVVRARENIIIGGVLENSVLSTALGFLQRGKYVDVISDAVGGYDDKAMYLSLREIKEKGGNIIRAEDVAGDSYLKRKACFHEFNPLKNPV